MSNLIHYKATVTFTVTRELFLNAENDDQAREFANRAVIETISTDMATKMYGKANDAVWTNTVKSIDDLKTHIQTVWE